MAKRVTKTKVKEIPETAQSNISLVRTCHPYGKFGLVQNIKSDSKTLTQLDLLHLAYLPPKFGLKDVVTTLKKNFFSWYESSWHIQHRYDHFGKPLSSISHFEFLNRGVECIYLDEFLPSFADHSGMWAKNYKKVFDQLDFEFKRMASNMARMKLVFAFRKGSTFKPEYVPIIREMWLKFGLPFEDSFKIMFRFHIFTSSIPGIKPSEKLAFMQSLPNEFGKMVCLIADDIGLKSTSVISEKIGSRYTFDATEVKDGDGKMIKYGYEPYDKLMQDYKSPSAIIWPPAVFMKHEGINEKALKYYSKETNVIIY